MVIMVTKLSQENLQPFYSVVSENSCISRRFNRIIDDSPLCLPIYHQLKKTIYTRMQQQHENLQHFLRLVK